MNTDRVKKFLELENKQKDLEKLLAEVKKEQAVLESEILAEFEDESCSSVKVNGSTVHLHRSLFASVKDGDHDRAIKALHSLGFRDLVHTSFNLNQVSAVVREADREGKELPEDFKEAFNVFEKFSVRVRNS